MFKSKMKEEERLPSGIKPYEYKRVNFLNAFRQMGFSFLEDEPSLLVEKVLSVDPDWIGHANYEAYGHRDFHEPEFYRSNATEVPCLEGEWIVVCYNRECKRIEGNDTRYWSEWHKYYVCQIDFSKSYLFRIVEEFEHIYDAFNYLYENKLVAIVKSEGKYKQQIVATKANNILAVLGDYENEEEVFSYDELLKFFSQHAEKSEKIKELLSLYNENKPSNCDESPEHRDELKRIRIRRFLSDEPYRLAGWDTKFTIKEYLSFVRKFKENYLWNL
ncbi:hypothetical protein [Psychrobacillus sp. FSL K6-1464]|uniref:hypothetical protein n=1 Tax=Psychrobacillus sp. FSL K6-1464 TaxID=2921545 RepID=UPI0030FB49D3